MDPAGGGGGPGLGAARINRMWTGLITAAFLLFLDVYVYAQVIPVCAVLLASKIGYYFNFTLTTEIILTIQIIFIASRCLFRCNAEKEFLDHIFTFQINWITLLDIRCFNNVVSMYSNITFLVQIVQELANNKQGQMTPTYLTESTLQSAITKKLNYDSWGLLSLVFALDEETYTKTTTDNKLEYLTACFVLSMAFLFASIIQQIYLNSVTSQVNYLMNAILAFLRRRDQLEEDTQNNNIVQHNVGAGAHNENENANNDQQQP